MGPVDMTLCLDNASGVDHMPTAATADEALLPIGSGLTRPRNRCQENSARTPAPRGEIKSERWARSDRNPGRFEIGMPGRNHRNPQLMRKIGVCEERGSGIDKVIESVEEATLPPPEFRADGESTKAIIFGPKSFGELTPEERVRGCYQHAVLKYVNTHAGMTNGSLRVRFGVPERNASQISRVIKQAAQMGLIKASDNWTARAGHYLPFWA
ncbi:ATP-binding protein [Bradyrhizobium sp. LMG 9283]|uniref:ATP-binding protein n=1 Tax=Bradyrhizobium sp. LMG 9283 TaxID=592064 RepID=UPI0038900B8C